MAGTVTDQRYEEARLKVQRLKSSDPLPLRSGAEEALFVEGERRVRENGYLPSKPRYRVRGVLR